MTNPRQALTLLLPTVLFLGVSGSITSDASVHGAVHDLNMNAVVKGSVSPAPTTVNQRPPKPEVTDQTTYAGGTFTYTVPEVTDPDGDSLTYQAFLGASNPLPQWIRFDSDTRTFTFKPRNPHVGEMQIRVSVSDGSLESYADFTLEVTAEPTNRPPTAPTLTDQTATEDESFSYAVPAFTDPDGDTLTYTAAQSNDSALPDWLSFIADTHTLSGTPEEADTPATLTIRITASDGTLSTSATFTLTVEEVNDPPVASNDSASVAEGGTLNINTSTLLANDSDPEGATLTISSVSNATNGSVSLSEDKATVTYTHDGSETTSGGFDYSVSDGSATSTATVSITVTSASDPPVASNDSASVAEGGTININASTLLANDSDADDDTLAITAVSDAASGSVVLSEDGETVTYTHNGLETISGGFTYTVSDGSNTDTATVTITVTPVNDPPETPSLANQAATEDESFHYTFDTVSDPEGDGVTFSATLADGSTLPGWLSFDAATRTFSGRPMEPDTPDTLAIRVTATDDGEPAESTSAAFTLTVEEVNDPPVAMSLSDQTAFVDDLFSYTIPEASDPEGITLTYDAFQGSGNNPLPRWLRFDKNTMTFSGRPLEADIATHEIMVSVSDDLYTSNATFQLSVVLPANRPPMAPTLQPQTATEDSYFFYQALAFTDPDGDPLTHRATLSDGGTLPTWLNFTADASTLIFSGTPREADTPGTLAIRVTATDGTETADAAFTLTVIEVNDLPTANAGPDQTVGEDETVILDGSGSFDPEGLPLAYAWIQIRGPSVALSGVDTASPAFTTPDNLASDAVLRFALVVADTSNAASTADDVRVLVKARAPLSIIPVDNPTATPVGTQVATPNSIPTFDSAVVEDMTFTVGQQVETSPLPSARGGDGTLKYRLSSDLPSGLRFDVSFRVITGTPTNAMERTGFTYTATDSDGDSASLRFHITIAEPVVAVETDDRSTETSPLLSDIGQEETPEPTPTPIPPPTTAWSLAPTPTPPPQPAPVPTASPQPTESPTLQYTPTATPSPRPTTLPAATPTDEAKPRDDGSGSVQVWVIIALVVYASMLTGATAIVINRKR